MVGQGVLRECLLDPDVEQVLSIVRAPTARNEPKLRELVHNNFFDFSAVENELAGYDACFFCLGVSSAGMKEADYRRVTYDLTLAAARTLVRLNPNMTFIYVSGTGTDSSEKGRSMWARVKGKTENDLLRSPSRLPICSAPGTTSSRCTEQNRKPHSSGLSTRSWDRCFRRCTRFSRNT